MTELQQLAEMLLKGDVAAVRGLTERLLQNNIAPQTILNGGLIAGMDVVGQKMRDCEIYLPDVLQSARADFHGTRSALLSLQRSCWQKRRLFPNRSQR
jgi:5-methyltetrahydrofolate--homocysteine methyltransferase